MTQLAAYTPEVAREILDAVRWLRQSGFVLGAGPRDAPAYGPDRATARNDQGSTMPAWALVQLVGAEAADKRPVSIAKRPADTMAQAGPYAVAANGRDVVDDDRFPLQAGPVLRILTDGSTLTAGTRWDPVASQWYVAPSVFGRFELLGADPIDDVGLFVDCGPQLLRRGRADATITAGSSGTVSLRHGSTDSGINVTAHYDHADDGVDIEAGTDVWVRWCPIENRWEIAGGGCEPA